MIAAILAACLLPSSASAVLGPKHRGELSPDLARLSKPALRSKSPARQSAALGIPVSGPGSLLREGRRVFVNLRFSGGAISQLPELRKAGARVIGASRRYQTATVAAIPAELRELTAVPGVRAAWESRAPIVYAVNCEGGSVISEGVQQLGAKAAREEFGVNGGGVTVGVISDSYDEATEAADGSGNPIATKAADDVASADLPGAGSECVGQTTPVNVLEDFNSPSATDEGRAMLQIVHDVAPEASLAFATGFLSEELFAQAIEELAAAGAGVIVDDLAYFEEPFFQDGPVAAAIDKVTGEGVLYVSAAGNDNLFDEDGNEIASWEAPSYPDSGGCPGAIRSVPELQANHCADFNPGPVTDRTFGVKVEPEQTLTVDLQWAEAWNGVSTDLDLFLLNANGELLTGEAQDNLQTQRPVEILQWTNRSALTKTVQLVVNRFTGGDPRIKLALLQNGSGVAATEYPRSGGGNVVGPTVFGHAGSASAIAVGAVPFNNGEAIEPYSSRGPVTHYFGPVEGSAAAEPLSVPEAISKPDVAATDCGATTFFAQLVVSSWRFCGTSAAAPHAAGVLALMTEAEPLAEPSLLRSSLLDTGTAVGSFGPCAAGGGLVEAVAAAKAARGEISPEPPAACPPPDASGEAVAAPGFWGSEEPPQRPGPEPPPQPQPQATLPPATSISRHPPKRVRTRHRTARVVFRFASDQAGVTFLCSVDGGRFFTCGPSFARSLTAGPHVVQVKARNSAGQIDSTPAVYRFRIQRVI